jgi:hypothetical protein
VGPLHTQGFLARDSSTRVASPASARRLFALVAVSLLVSSANVSAQAGTAWSVQGSGIFVGIGGNAFEGLTGGPGAEGQLRFNFPNRLSLGAGFQWSSHSPASGYDFDDVSLAGPFLEPRFVFLTPLPRLAPYVSLRLAYLRQKTTFDGGSSDASATQANIGGGVLVALGGTANLDLGLTYGALSFGEVTVNAPGGGVSGELGSGTNLVLRAGLSIGIGR